VKEQPFPTYEGSLVFYLVYWHKSKENDEGRVGRQLQAVAEKFSITDTVRV
jgi:hypothetical protein